MSNKGNCIPTSSDCIIWQGGDIECLDLCYGDSITQVLYKLALLVCDLSDSLRGEDGDTPFIHEGFWWIGETNTGILATGPQGNVGPQGTQGVQGTDGLVGRGIAVFKQATTPTTSDFNSQYGSVSGFGINGIAGSNQLKTGDIWIKQGL